MDKSYYRIVTLAWLSLASIAPAQEANKVSTPEDNQTPVVEANRAPVQGDSQGSTQEDGKATAQGDNKATSQEDGKATAQGDNKATSQEDSKAAASQASPIQSAARPYSLSIEGPVQIAGSDAAAKAFQTNVLPGMMATERKLLPEYQYHTAGNLATFSFDPSKLVLSADTTARLYFLGEGAGYQNTLGISTTGGGPLSPGAALIFPNASSSVGFAGSGTAIRSANEPLLAGDFVDLGNLKAGTALDFFLIANGAVGGKDILSTNQSLNADGLVHAVAMSKVGSPYLVISFEDMKGGGDHDYNDVYFALDIGKANVARLMGLGAPEPSLAFGALLAGGALLGFGRRRR
ncbi:MAG: DUF4114 domain-containing protein [Verrucomicrobiota bacterium]